MYSELELEAYKIYADFMRDEWNLNWYNIDFFIEHKTVYKEYFDYAAIKLRKEKLNKISKNGNWISSNL